MLTPKYKTQLYSKQFLPITFVDKKKINFNGSIISVSTNEKQPVNTKITYVRPLFKNVCVKMYEEYKNKSRSQ